MTPRDIAAAYATPAALALLVGLLCRWEGDSGAMTFHKILIALLFPLALKGLRSCFSGDDDKARNWVSEVEYQILSAILTGAFFVLIVTPEAAADPLRQVLMFAIFILLAAPLQILLTWRSRRG
ncbi:hypothetical protein [Rhizobium sp. CSW-27]|uniref:hypothetical protein n=1 Tax=Rhizobium sp. CSW-27 TaxID=2839985 RepID=UPI001C010309|nr:hypothetical protein [Rhizobium sp. CSW-27]MBT9371513.1 hypothetical protein [Rhizobium sp. CSW-27]